MTLQRSRTPLLLIITLLALVAPSAFAYDIFEIHTGGTFGGLIRINGEFVTPPDGACGIEWNNVEAWQWGPSAGSPVVSGFGGGTMWYTVGYTTCADPGAPYNFVTPVTPTGDPFDHVLVIQADAGDGAWLNWALDEIPGPELGPDHDFPSICEMYPEFCESPVDEYAVPHPCDYNPDICGVDIALLDLPLAIEITRSTGRELGNTLELITGQQGIKGRTEIEASLAEARSRLDNAVAIARQIGAAADELRLDPDASSDVFVGTAGTFVAASRFALTALETARDRAADLSSSSTRAEIEAVLAEVTGACRLFETATTGAQDGVTFGGLAAARAENP